LSRDLIKLKTFIVGKTLYLNLSSNCILIVKENESPPREVCLLRTRARPGVYSLKQVKLSDFLAGTACLQNRA